MNNKAVTISLMMAILAVFFVQNYVSSIEETNAKRFGTQVMVIKAKRDIPEMESINETMLEQAPVPQNFLEPGAILEAKSLIGAVAVVPIRKGEQLTANKISEPNVRTGLAPQISPGKRGIAIPVTEFSGVGKLVKPGDRVDVIAILDPGAGRTNRIAKTILQDLVVLAVGRQLTNNIPRIIEWDGFSKKDRVKSLAQDYSFTSVTLEVDPSQAQALALMQAQTDMPMILSLRNNDDSDRAQVPATVFSDVVGSDLMRVNRAVASPPRR